LRPALKKYATTVRESITAWAWMMRWWSKTIISLRWVGLLKRL
jgi:hypothetical protein